MLSCFKSSEEGLGNTHTHSYTNTHNCMDVNRHTVIHTHTLFTLSLEHTLTHEPFCIALAVHPRGWQWLRTSHTHITNSHIQHTNTCQNAKLRQTLWVAVLWAPLDKSWSLWVCVPFRMNLKSLHTDRRSGDIRPCDLSSHEVRCDSVYHRQCFFPFVAKHKRRILPILWSGATKVTFWILELKLIFNCAGVFL